MSTPTCTRLLPWLRCRDALLSARRAHSRRSVLLQAISKHSSSTPAPLRRWSCLTQYPYLDAPFKTNSFSLKFSTTTGSDSKKANEKNPNAGSSQAASKANDFDLTGDPNKSLFKKFNENLKKYWYVMLPVHLITSGGYFVGFCYLASKGFSPVPLLEKMGLFEEYLKHIQGSKFGIFAVALVFQKMVSPIRYLTTWYTVKALAKRGKLLTSEQFFELLKKKYSKKTS